MVWLPGDEKNWRYVYSFWQNVRTWQTHRRTDGQTPHDDIGCACIASRGKNRTYVAYVEFCFVLSILQHVIIFDEWRFVLIDIIRQLIYYFERFTHQFGVSQAQLLLIVQLLWNIYSPVLQYSQLCSLQQWMIKLFQFRHRITKCQSDV